MYEYVSDVLRAMRIDPKDVMLIRHTDSPPEHHFRKAQEAGFIKEYTSLQKEGFAKGRDYLMVFIREFPRTGRFFALYRIVNRFPSRIGHIPADYPNREEIEEEGDYLELQEEQPPQGLEDFAIEWGGGRRFDQKAERDKRIIRVETTPKNKTGGTQA